ncbi:MAG TPA: DUF5984 family protein [Kofleriaceae bacterium]
MQRFRDELVRFDQDLIAAMQARVDALATGRPRPDIAIDVDALHREQADRAIWLRCAGSASSRAFVVEHDAAGAAVARPHRRHQLGPARCASRSL